MTDDIDFRDNKRYLESELDEMRSGNAQFIGLDDLDTRLENKIKELEQMDTKTKKFD